MDRPSARNNTAVPERASVKRAFKIVYTRDEIVSLSDDDPAMDTGWRCVPTPPTPGDDWLIVDSSNDYKTGWMRRVDLQGGGA